MHSVNQLSAFSSRIVQPHLNQPTLQSSQYHVTRSDQVHIQSKPNNLQFGCRFFGFISNEPNQKQGEMLNEMLLTGDNAILTQSYITPDHELAPRNWEYFFAHTTFPNGNFVTGMQNEGWGRVIYAPKESGNPARNLEPNLYKSTHGFLDESKHQVESFKTKLPWTYIMQLREASSLTSKTEIKLENSHPFVLGNFAFMHNGTLPANTVSWLQEQIERYHNKYGDEIPLPQGTSDSEKVFMYMMGRLREKYGTVDNQKLSTEQIKEVFQETLQRMEWLNSQPGNGFQVLINKDFLKQSGFAVDENSAFRFSYGLNFCLTDGQRLFLSRQHRSLHVAALKDAKGQAQAAMFATYPPQPRQKSERLDWFEIPEAHMITIERSQDSQPLRLKMEPFSLGATQNSLNLMLWQATVQAQLMTKDITDKMEAVVKSFQV